ncbi:c-type cytochrome biogenesis protein CcsB [Rhodococcus antarcticus]|uniref:C-type cytochrome biogenesis protein CcsB n=1 Tax=Rhodococcus antarcticus TaxID=2987751 RepID=A0ABY6P0H2_9NOCA|nr:c-type cytochrome biogenesis protein CcsB [Rhodococcus antarcticus]UZJ25157.1 c-type cytochrome biogenesis protein CcsB [Rhodococcus antarcticus]
MSTLDLAELSDLGYRSAVAVYVLAAALLACELASVRTSTVVRREARRQLVGSGAPAVPPRRSTLPGRVEVPVGRSLADRLGRMGVALVALGLALHVGSLVLRGISAGRAPWGNMYEFTSLATAVTVLGTLVVLGRHTVRPLSVFVLLPVVVLMFIGGTTLYATSAPVVPALQSYWLVIHVSVIATASGVLLLSGIASLLFLLRRHHAEGAEGSSTVGRLARLPGAQVLDRVAYRTAIFAFPLFTVGVILGAIWAEAAWGRFWGWDPKEVTAFITWVVYAAYLHARATAGWRNTRAAWINVVGTGVVLFNLFFINIVVSGLHSYAGLN